MATPPTFTAYTPLAAATMNKVGMWRVATASATSGSVLDILGCFTTDYTNYMVTIDNLASTAASNIYIGMLSGGTVNGSQWIWGSMRLDYGGASINVNRASSDPYCYITVASSTGAAAAKIDIFQPQMTQYTNVLAMGTDNRGSTGYLPSSTGGTLQNTTAYDGLRIYNSASTFTKINVVVYGYNEG